MFSILKLVAKRVDVDRSNPFSEIVLALLVISVDLFEYYARTSKYYCPTIHLVGHLLHPVLLPNSSDGI